MARLPERRPLLCYITDRNALPEGNLRPAVEAAARAGTDLIQIRERDLPARELLACVEWAVALTARTPTRILVNDRLDIAQVTGAGLHLPAHSFPVGVVRARAGSGLLVGASTHNLEELRAAEQGGADFAVFGPVFETPSKRAYGSPLGLEKLAEAVRAVRIPVLALGGITLANAAGCLGAGAAGIAAITLFQTSTDLATTVLELRALSPGRET